MHSTTHVAILGAPGCVGKAVVRELLVSSKVTITASFGTFTDATETVTIGPAPGVPGFEVLTLLVALGVAFILLRRRRH